jgi:hypothetical protein
MIFNSQKSNAVRFRNLMAYEMGFVGAQFIVPLSFYNFQVPPALSLSGIWRLHINKNGRAMSFIGLNLAEH